MPREAALIGAVEDVAPLAELPRRVMQALGRA
jgi:chemotaxis response regulator CheB